MSPLGKSFTAPPASAGIGTLSALKKEEDDRLAAPMKQLESLVKGISKTAPSKDLLAVHAAMGLTANPTASTYGAPTSSAPLLHLSTRVLPTAAQLRGPPRLGRQVKHVRVNRETGAEETDSEAEKEELLREESDRQRKSWWQPSKHTRCPSTLKKPAPQEKATGAYGDHKEAEPQKEYTLQVNNKHMRLTDAQAKLQQRLSRQVAEAEAIVAATDARGTDRFNLAQMERRHRAHAEMFSDFGS